MKEALKLAYDYIDRQIAKTSIKTERWSGK